MSSDPIGYYVHHHGRGHAHRFARIRDASDQTLVPITELDLPGAVRLPSDVGVDSSDPTAGGALHWAPVGDIGGTRRAHLFGSWLDRAEPNGVVVDVSVEATLLCRLFGVATIVVRQHGHRSDLAHELAYRSAKALLAPFPPELEHPDTPAWIRDKTRYAGIITGRSTPAAAANAESRRSERVGPDDVVILWGTGGGTLDESFVDGIAGATAGRVWIAGGAGSETGLESSDVTNLGWVDDVSGLLAQRPLVVGSAGNNVVADAASARCALIAVPQSRPFDEQRHHAQALDAAQLAVVVEPGESAVDWASAFELARRRADALAALSGDRRGAQRAAQIIRSTFARERTTAT